MQQLPSFFFITASFRRSLRQIYGWVEFHIPNLLIMFLFLLHLLFLSCLRAQELNLPLIIKESGHC